MLRAPSRVTIAVFVASAAFTFRAPPAGAQEAPPSRLPCENGIVRNDVDPAQARSLDAAIRASLHFARANEAAVMPYVRDHAVEMNDEVMKSHIGLYVNEFTDDLGDSGRAAVHALFTRARDAGILHRSAEPIFAT